VHLQRTNRRFHSLEHNLTSTREVGLVPTQAAIGLQSQEHQDLDALLPPMAILRCMHLLPSACMRLLSTMPTARSSEIYPAITLAPSGSPQRQVTEPNDRLLRRMIHISFFPLTASNACAIGGAACAAGIP